MPPLGNVAVGRRRRLLSRDNPGGIRESFTNRGPKPPVVPPEAFSAAHGLQKKQRQDKAFRKCAAARLEAYLAATIAAPVWGNHECIGGVAHRHLKMTDDRRGGLQIDPILHDDRRRAQSPQDAVLIGISYGVRPCLPQSAAPGSIRRRTAETRFAGKPPRRVCSRTVSSSGAW
jgi:hypothetical protein